MSTLQELYEALKKHSDFEIEDNAERFLDIVGKIINHQAPSSIGILLDYFDDNSEYMWVFQSLIQGIESYPDEIYVKNLLNKTKDALKKYPEWFGTLINRLLNDNKCKDIFYEHAKLVPRQDLFQLLHLIEQEYPHHKNLINEFREKLRLE